MVLASRSGPVSFVRNDQPNVNFPVTADCFGNGIEIRHDDGRKALYWHLQQDGACVTVGQSVDQGDVIGLSGHTGLSTFPHLHWEVRGATDVPLFADVPGDGSHAQRGFTCRQMLLG